MAELQDYDLVVLLTDISAMHKVTRDPLILKRGQVGTVLMRLEEGACLIDFADQQGETFAMETVELVNLLKLIHEPVLAIA
ncbi:MAG: DUF4926 domain-containing protein [Cyanobacteria bacterium P01_C01_bin.89]